MNDDQQRSSRSDAYRAARDQFDQLRIEERAQFLVEAMLVTIGRGIETAGETISREMDGALTSVREAVRDASEAMRGTADRPHRTPGAAEGATADEGAPPPPPPPPPPAPPKPPKAGPGAPPHDPFV